MSEPRPPLKSLLRDEVDPKRKAAIWQRIEARRDAAPKLRNLRPLFWAASAVACAAALAYFDASQRDPSSDPSPQPTAASAPVSAPMRTALQLANGRAVEPVTTTRATRIDLSDGTFIELAASTKIESVQSSPEAFELRVQAGSATFDVRPQLERRFVVHAGEARVIVVGTRFTVSVRADVARTVDVTVEHGLVQVLAATLPNGQASIAAGQAVHVVAAVEPVGTVTSESTARAPTAAPVVPAAARARAYEAAKRGDFEDAYTLFGDRGFAAALAEAKSVDQLLLLADTARLSGHPAQAASAFGVILAEHPRDERASLAALSLGRIELDQRKRPAAAAVAFERALKLGLPSGLLEDAHARRVQALAQAGQRDDARAAANEYLTRFPQGRRRADVERWVGSE